MNTVLNEGLKAGKQLASKAGAAVTQGVDRLKGAWDSLMGGGKGQKHQEL
jgi:hypothetical protein